MGDPAKSPFGVMKHRFTGNRKRRKKSFTYRTRKLLANKRQREKDFRKDLEMVR